MKRIWLLFVTNKLAWLATALSLVGNVGVVNKQSWGMACWLCANALWIRHHWIKRDWPSLSLFTAYFGLAFWGLWNWLR